jgi:hypothetical protein
MNTFLFAAGSRGVPPGDLLNKAGRIVKDLMPARGASLEVSSAVLPELNGGWLRLSPQAEQPSKWIHALEQHERAVLIFGNLSGGPPETTAERMIHTWREEGLNAVRLMDGSFGAVLIDRAQKEIHLVSDLTGRRYLRFFEHDGLFLVSPHDLPIVATGLCPIAFDEASACSIVSWGWSLHGDGLLKAIRTLRPDDHVTWSAGGLKVARDPLVNFRDRLSAQDRAACTALVERMIEEMRAEARVFASGHQEIRVALTAGLDTRALLALLISVVKDPSRLHAFTIGEADCLESKVARQIAAQNDCRYSVLVPEAAGVEDFIRRCDVRAFHMNGDTTSKQASLQNRFPNALSPSVNGRGGEIYRGFYYKGEIFHDKLFSAEHAFKRLMGKVEKRFRRLPWKDPQGSHSVLKGRLTNVMDEYQTLSSDGYDALDLFYLRERFGWWGAQTVRFPWSDAGWDPFTRSWLIRSAYRLPSPIAVHCRLQETLIRCYMPAGYRVRINGNRSLALVGRGILPALLRKADYNASAMWMRLHSLWRSRLRGRRVVDELRTQVFAGPLADVVRDTLQSEGSFGLRFFGKKGLERLSDVDVLGSLVTMERWRVMVEEAHRRAAVQALPVS